MTAIARRRSWIRLLRTKSNRKPEQMTDVQRFEHHSARLNEFHTIFDQILTRIVEVDDEKPAYVEARLNAEYEALGELQSVVAKEETAFRSFHSALAGQSARFLSQWRMSDGEILSVQSQALCEVFEWLAQDIKRQQVAISARLIEFS